MLFINMIIQIYKRVNKYKTRIFIQLIQKRSFLLLYFISLWGLDKIGLVYLIFFFSLALTISSNLMMFDVLVVLC